LMKGKTLFSQELAHTFEVQYHHLRLDSFEPG
jgi:hypothetical protein